VFAGIVHLALIAGAPVAQLDRATGYGPVGCGFNSCRAYQPLHQSKLINQLLPGEVVSFQSPHPAQQDVAASPVASPCETTRDNQRPPRAKMMGLPQGWREWGGRSEAADGEVEAEAQPLEAA
jgi:hypothetical protein